MRSRIFDAKVLNFLELPKIIHFPHIYGIHTLLSIFPSINGASRILNVNLILMVLTCFAVNTVYIYLCLSISVLKSCHIVIDIHLDCLHPTWCFSYIAFIFFDNLSLTVLTKYVITKKSVSLC